MSNSLISNMLENPTITLKGKNIWLPEYNVTFNFKENTYSDYKSKGKIPEEAKEKFFKVLGTIENIPEPQEPTRKVKIDCVYQLQLFGHELHYTNYTFQINPQLTNLQRALLELSDACGLKVY